jgi:hypothetical protein
MLTREVANAEFGSAGVLSFQQRARRRTGQVWITDRFFLGSRKGFLQCRLGECGEEDDH